MNRNRPLSLTMIRALHRGLKIPAAVLVEEPAIPYEPAPRKPRGSKTG